MLGICTPVFSHNPALHLCSTCIFQTTLTQAITKVLSEKGWSDAMSYEDIDRAPEEKARKITINTTHIEYETQDRHYGHIDW